MSKNFYTCEDCTTAKYEDEGIYYNEACIFICDTCYDRQLDEDYAAMQDALAVQKNYPHLDHYVQMQKNDPVAFYLTCKDNPDGLFM